jgi:hypothetical protein
MKANPRSLGLRNKGGAGQISAKHPSGTKARVHFFAVFGTAEAVPFQSSGVPGLSEVFPQLGTPNALSVTTPFRVYLMREEAAEAGTLNRAEPEFTCPC